MTVSYKKLWHLLLDKNMKKKDLQEAAGLTQYAMLKLGRDEDVSTEILGKICQALECSPEKLWSLYQVIIEGRSFFHESTVE